MRNALLSNELCQIVVVMISRMETNKLSSNNIIADFNTTSNTKHTVIPECCSIANSYSFSNTLKSSCTLDSCIFTNYYAVTY